VLVVVIAVLSLERRWLVVVWNRLYLDADSCVTGSAFTIWLVLLWYSQSFSFGFPSLIWSSSRKVVKQKAKVVILVSVSDRGVFYPADHVLSLSPLCMH